MVTYKIRERVMMERIKRDRERKCFLIELAKTKKKIVLLQNFIFYFYFYFYLSEREENIFLPATTSYLFIGLSLLVLSGLIFIPSK